MDGQLGAFCGAAPFAGKTLGDPCKRIVIVDHTAGDAQFFADGSTLDGMAPDPHVWPSPLSAARHAAIAGQRHDIEVEVWLYERNPATHALLLDNLGAQLGPLGWDRFDEDTWGLAGREGWLEVYCDDGATAPLDTLGKGDFVYLLADGNDMTATCRALPLDAIGAAIKAGARVSLLATLGCNANGLKRLPPEARQEWSDHLDELEAISRPLRGQDLLLLAIERDQARWGYLLATPKAWLPGARTDARKVFRREELELMHASRKKDPELYQEIRDWLIYTKAELAARGA